MVSDNESLTLEQFVTMCISQKCNSMLLESILKVTPFYTQLREMRDLPIHASLVEKIGFVKNTPFNFEDMVKKLVYQKEVKEMREMVADSNVIEELMDLDYSRFSDKQKDAFKLILAIKEKTVEGFKDLPKGQQKEMLQRHAETYQKNTDVIKLLFEFQTSNFQHLLDIYQKSCDVHANSVSKYEMIYQLNKRNIITSDTLEENKGGQKEQFYKDYFQRVTDEKEHSELSGFPYQKGML
jgi:hypothetical protein